MICVEEQFRTKRNPVSGLFALDECPQERLLWPLFLVSFSALYMELLLIRWIGTEVRVFAYFQNLALIACFLGFGVGCYQSKAKKLFLFDAVALGILAILVGAPFIPWQERLESLSSALSFSPDAQMWSIVFQAEKSSLTGKFLISVLLISGLLILVVATMIPLGQWVGTYLNAAKNPVSAYSANLLGSLAGIWFFAGMSFAGLAPVFWFAFAFVLFLLVALSRRAMGQPQLAGCVLLGSSLVLLAYAAFGRGPVYWSPYQKLEVAPAGDEQFNILVNNTGYMTVANLSPNYLATHPEVARAYKGSSYDAPFRFVGNRDRVLVVGAGAGNDVDAALRNGARHIDAVEIDPGIYSLGKRIHPDRPYDSTRVHVIINDARAFLRQSQSTYDVIIFGLLDSHTEFSGYSNMRIDNYVYTEESLREAKRLLKPSGVLIIKFAVRIPLSWMGQRFYSMIDRLFGRPPVTFFAPQMGAMLSATEFIASRDSGAWDRAAQPELAEMIKRNPAPFGLDLEHPPAVTTDDWPYVYHRNHTIPHTYLTVSLILIALAFFFARRGFEPAKVSTWNFFFLGAGFLLLETQMISRLALYFGSTWWVNCIALSAILLVLVLSNLLVQHGVAARGLLPWYAGLIVSLLAIYFVPWESMPFQTITAGSLLAGGYCVPLFFAGVIFTETFRACEDKSRCFASNMIGAVAGGLAQNMSFIFGMKALLPLAALFYVLAAVFGMFGARTELLRDKTRRLRTSTGVTVAH